MDKNPVLYGYALLDGSNNAVSIDDINHAYTRLHKFYCPHCHNEMYATFGPSRAPHFRHKGNKCQYSKYLHDLAEHVFFEEYSRCLENGSPFYLELHIPRPCNNACVLKDNEDCKEHYVKKIIDLTKEYTKISRETRVELDDHFRRPDILLESLDGKQLWVEIWVSHETEEEKRKDGQILEVKIVTEADLKMFRQNKIVQSEGNNLDVRIFSNSSYGKDSIFECQDDGSCVSYPCERFFCFEVRTNGYKQYVTNYINNQIKDDSLSYRVVFRLNWLGRHDSVGEHSGKKTVKLDDLSSFSLQKYYSIINNDRYLDSTYDPLIVFEWKSEDINTDPVLIAKPNYLYTYKPLPKPELNPSVASIDVEEIEWVDLGLSSGILWAKNDAEGKISFMRARMLYGDYIPSKENVEELCDYCREEWDDKTQTRIFTGPNGKSIEFSTKEKYQSYWLNDYEKGDKDFGQCFHISSDMHLMISDKTVVSSIYVRLVKRIKD